MNNVPTTELIADSKDIVVSRHEHRVLDHHQDKLRSSLMNRCGPDFRVELHHGSHIRVQGPRDKLKEAGCVVSDLIRDVAQTTVKLTKPGFDENIFNHGNGLIHREHLEVKHKCVIEAALPRRRSPSHLFDKTHSPSYAPVAAEAKLNKPTISCLERELDIHVWALGGDKANNVITKINEMIDTQLYSCYELPIVDGISEECSDKVLELQSHKVKVDIRQSQHKVILAGCKDEVVEAKIQAHKLIIEDQAEQKFALKKTSFEGIQRQRPDLNPTSYLHLLSEAEVLIPSYWTHNAGEPLSKVIKEKPELRIAELQLNEQRGKAITELVSATWSSELVGRGQDAANLKSYKKLRVTKIERVENPRLWKAYTTKRADLLLNAAKGAPRRQKIRTHGQNLDKTVVTDINETYLFHGLPMRNVRGIQSQGFDPRLSGSSVLFGSGSYFAESTTKADQYSDDRQSRTEPGHPLAMLLCRVLLGSAYKCDEAKDFKRPPCTQCHDDKCADHETFHDSVIGVKKEKKGRALLFREFVIYDKSQSYPEYIIHYERHYGQLSSPEEPGASSQKLRRD
ncbi:hypothetical protein CAPTEDRAFT_192002 [Capitella teleta]|uniref:Poly [ADP-ribose] polymerase n=1 Tax=Capitella teleta TaxID=283909 RepID=R7THM8_CAPTE|nr:hypothetical protein CAPTEDRAFT_192002 [Capitella teleta]|eukprot:ELT90615.1 hypothetical protein CAPTEDRAFT_192002 [Capitella teleta]